MRPCSRRRVPPLVAPLVAPLVVLLLAVLCGTTATAATVAGSAANAAPADAGRLDLVVRTLLAGEIYLEPSLAAGDVGTWEPRLRRAASAVDAPGGVAVAGWVSVPGSSPDPDVQGEDVADAYVAAGGGADLLLLGQSGGFFPAPVPDAPRALTRRAIRAAERSSDVATEAARRYAAAQGIREPAPGGVGVEEVRVIPAGRLWIELRLLAADAPSPGALAAQVAADPVFFADDTNYSSYPGYRRSVRDDPTERVSSLVVLVLVVVGYLLLRAGRAWSGARRRRRAETTDVRTFASPAEVELAVTRLAEALARAPVRLDDLGYRRAQRCRDAAERYVDRDAERDRVGVLLLCRDGLVWLGGGEPEPRCYFDPAHPVAGGLVTVGRDGPTADGSVVTALEDVDARLPCCRECADRLDVGEQPRGLRVATDARPDDGARRRPYYEVDDSWTRTGYGSLSAEWAQQVLDESWAPQRGTDR